MSDKLRSPGPMAGYSLSCRSSPDPTANERYPRSDSPDRLLNSSRLSSSFGDISNVGSDRYSRSGRKDSLLSWSSPRLRDYSDFAERDVGSRSVSPSMRGSPQEEIIANHKRVSRLRQDLMTANKKIGRMDVLYEETNKRKIRLQEELLEACTKVAKLEATCGSYRENETQLQQVLSVYRQQNSKLELDVLSAFRKVSQLDSELETIEEKKNGAQREHIAAQERVSVLEAAVDKMKRQQSSNRARIDDFTIGRKVTELEEMNTRYLKENEDLRQEIRQVKSKKIFAEDQLNKSLIEKASLDGQLSQARETPKQDESFEILLNELNRFKELYQKALKTNPEAKDYQKLVIELERHKEDCSRANEKLRGMLEYESKFKEAKVKEEQLRVELNGAGRKLSLAEEQLQKALKEKAKIAMEIGKSNDKGIKIHEKLVSMEKELNHYKNVFEESGKHRVDAEGQLGEVLKERDVLVKQCRDLTKEVQKNDIELKALLSAAEAMKSKLDNVKESALTAEAQCVELTRNNQVVSDDLEESNGALAQVQTELARCKRQLNEYKDQADTWEHKETEGNKRGKQLALDIEEAHEKLDEKTAEFTELGNKLKKCQEEKENVTEELDILQDKIVGLESLLNRAERQKNGQESERNDLEETLLRHRDELKNLRKELEEQKTELEKAYHTSHDEIMKGEQRLKEMEGLEMKYDKTVGKFTELERKYEVVVGERQELRREVLKGESDVTQLERSLNLVNKEKNELLSEVTTLNSCKTKQDNIVAKIEKELFEVKDEYEQLVVRSQDDQIKLKKQGKELEGALERMEAQSVQVDELVERCETFKQERKELRENVHNMKEQCSHLQSQLDKDNREKENIIEELNEATRKVKRREEEIENFGRKFQEQGEILERGNRRTREEQGQLRSVKQELEIKTDNYEEKCQEFDGVKAKYEVLLQDYDGKKKEILNAESTIGKLETVVGKVERENAELVSEITKRESNTAKQNEVVLKLQKQLKEVKDRFAGSQQDGDELKGKSKRLADENRGLLKELAQKNSDCVELETSLKEAQSSRSSVAREVKKLQGKCDEFEKQTESGSRDKLKLTEELKANEEIRERASNEVNRYKEQAKEYKNLYETNLRDSVTRNDSLEKKSLKNEELLKKYSKMAIELSEVEKRLEEAKTNNTKLKKECFMKQTKVAKLEELLQKAIQENETLTGIEREFVETQDELQERNNDVEHLEVEVNTLKLRICDLDAAKFTLEKSNVILKAANETERVEKSLKKIQELQRDFQKTRLEKEVLEKRLSNARNVMKEKEAQDKELTRIGQQLQQNDQELSDKEFQLSFLKKDNQDLKENVGQLKEKMAATEAEKKWLTAELKLSQNPKKSGYTRGSLFIGNQETELRSDVSLPVGPQTSTPLNSPRNAGSHSRSLELNKKKPHPGLYRKYSLDSSSYVASAHRVHERLSTSLDNLVYRPRPSSLDVRSSSDKDTTNESLSLESLGPSEGSMDSLDARIMIEQIENSPISPEARKMSRLAEDWETLSSASSVVGPVDESVFVDLDDEGEMSDTASVKDLKQHFEIPNIPPPPKSPRRSLSRTPPLTTLVEKHEELTNPSDVAPKTSPISPNINEPIMEFDVIIRENDVTPANPEITLVDHVSRSDTKVSTAVPNIPDVIPSTSDIIPNKSDVIPNNSDDIPDMFDGTSKSDGASKLRDDFPRTSDEILLDFSTEMTSDSEDRLEAGLEARNANLFQEDQPNKEDASDYKTKKVNDRKVEVKNVKSLWEELDTQKRNKEERISMKNKPREVRKFEKVSKNPSSSKTVRNATPEVVIVGDDSSKTEKPGRVCDLVNLFSK